MLLIYRASKLDFKLGVGGVGETSESWKSNFKEPSSPKFDGELRNSDFLFQTELTTVLVLADLRVG